MFRSVVFVSLVMAVALAAAGCGAEAPGQKVVVVSLAGKVEVGKGGDWEAAQVGMRVRQSMSVRTVGAQSTVELAAESGSAIKLGGDSQLEMAQLFRDDTSGLEKTTLGLASGTVLVKARALAAGEEFRVRTATASVGVRGTEFEVVTTGTNEDTQVNVNEGKVDVQRTVDVQLDEADQDLKPAVDAAVTNETTVSLGAGQRASVNRAENRRLAREFRERVRARSKELREGLARNKDDKARASFLRGKFKEDMARFKPRRGEVSAAASKRFEGFRKLRAIQSDRLKEWKKKRESGEDRKDGQLKPGDRDKRDGQDAQGRDRQIGKDKQDGRDKKDGRDKQGGKDRQGGRDKRGAKEKPEGGGR